MTRKTVVLRRLVAKALSWAEAASLAPEGRAYLPPVFIFGVPRSGTTLIYQAITRRFKSSYFCNLANRFFLCPGLISTWGNRLGNIAPPDCFSSQYGKGATWRSPSQGNRIWSRWFPGPQIHHSVDEIDRLSFQEMRDTVHHVQNVIGGVFVNKSIGHSVRLGPLLEAFPDAVLIHVVRDPQQVAESILCGRQECFGDKNHWFSVRPRQYSEIVTKPAIQQVCEQGYWVKQNIIEDIRTADCQNMLTLAYEDFCNSPLEMCDRVANFYFDKTGKTIEIQHSLPEVFPVSLRKKVSAEETSMIRDYLSVL